MTSIFVLILSASILQAIDYLYHYNRVCSIRKIDRIDSIRDAHFIFKKIGIGAKPYDNLIGTFPFIWSWLLIVSCVLISFHFNNFILNLIFSFFIATRMRALQEIGHFAMHGTLVKSKKLGLFLTNIFCQYPLLLKDSAKRQNSHCIKHHPNAGIIGKDPNIDEFIAIGFKPKISFMRFTLLCFYPITLKGIKNKLSSIFHNYSRMNLLRLSISAILIIPFLISGHYTELFLFYFIPVLFIYPLLAWISQIVEHRWFVDTDANMDKYEKELIIGRPTSYSGLFGFFIKECIFPFGDSFHLTHSLFQYARYNYLPSIDKILSINTDYMKHASHGLIFKNGNSRHSAFSELKERITA